MESDIITSDHVNSNGKTDHPDNHTTGSENASIEPQNPYKFQEPNSWVFPKKPTSDKPPQKRPFLKKGAGIARFYGGKIPGVDFPNPFKTTTSKSPTMEDKNHLELTSANSRSTKIKQKQVVSSISGNGRVNNNGTEENENDVLDFRGGGIRVNGKQNGVRGGGDNSPLPSQVFQEQEDPYLEMDSSFTESESQHEANEHRDSFTEDDDISEGNNKNSPISKNISKQLTTKTKGQDTAHDDFNLEDEDENSCIEDDKELKIFEMMEKIAEEEPNLCSNSPLVSEFINSRLDLSPVPRSNGNIKSNGSTPNMLANSRKNSYSLNSVASSTSTPVGGSKDINTDAIPPNVLERVLEQVRVDSEKFHRILSESGTTKTSTELQGALLTARTLELEAEIKKFREENKNILALREQWQVRYNELENSQMEHQQLKNRELRLIDEEKVRLARKKERLTKMMAEYDERTAELDITTTDAETQINLLNAKITQLQRDIRSKNSQFAKAQNKLKEEIASLQEENSKLHAEIERLRKGNRDHRSTSASKPLQKTVAAVGTDTADFSEPNKPNTKGAESMHNMPTSPTLAEGVATTNSCPVGSNQPEENVSQPKAHSDQSEEVLERILSNGDREIRYSNGTTKTVSKDGLYTRVMFYNGDIREAMRDGSVRYFYNETSSWHTTYPDGLEVVEFPSGQIERKNPNGVIEIIYSNGCIKHIYPCGKEECIFPDQTILRTERNGDKVLLLANGQKEYQTKDFRKRLYPDGTVKIVYSDGSQETRYPNGRVRMKNSDGKLIHDAIHPLPASPSVS